MVKKTRFGAINVDESLETIIYYEYTKCGFSVDNPLNECPNCQRPKAEIKPVSAECTKCSSKQTSMHKSLGRMCTFSEDGPLMRSRNQLTEGFIQLCDYGIDEYLPCGMPVRDFINTFRNMGKLKSSNNKE